jgi:hypothetical protein
MYSDEDIKAATDAVKDLVDEDGDNVWVPASGQLRHPASEMIARAALDAVPRWRPISEAPKDETRLLLFVPPYGPSTGHWARDAEEWRCHSILNRAAKPTHWTPLPPPPTDTTEERDG